jgi:hypothetical protein
MPPKIAKISTLIQGKKAFFNIMLKDKDKQGK